ncbi:Bromodomain associated-domain-containing protein [Phycomyces nitens]|nr:Bromodomain associated-domain-containing protein [Phycomyces nitens]
MTDKFCFALLRITTLQILQSAGYESVHVDPTDILTDVFGQYIQMLGATTNAYAQLAGRTTGTLQDVVDGLEDLAVDTNTLRDWLEEEGKALTPSWSASSDPGRFLQGNTTMYKTKGKSALVRGSRVFI